MADVCGPWTLEQLDQFGTLDSLPFSLDSDVWLTACIRDGDGAVNGAGTVTSSPLRERFGEGFVTSSATVTATGTKLLIGQGSISGIATVVAACARLRQIDELQDIIGYVDVYAVPGVQFEVTERISGVGTVTASPTRTLQFAGGISAAGAVDATGYILGEEWGDITDESNTWTPISDQSNVWTETANGNNTWQRRG